MVLLHEKPIGQTVLHGVKSPDPSGLSLSKHKLLDLIKSAATKYRVGKIAQPNNKATNTLPGMGRHA